MSKFTEKDIQNICTRVAVSAWEKLTELEATFGEKYLEKFETILEDSRYPVPRCLKKDDSRALFLTSKVLRIESLGLDYRILRDFFSLCDIREQVPLFDPQNVYPHSHHSFFFPIYKYYLVGSDREKELENLRKQKSYQSFIKEIEQMACFINTMASFGLVALSFCPNAVIPADTGDLMLLPNWREYRESVRKQEEENKRLQEKKEEEKKYQAILSELERLRKLEADVSKIVAADPPKKSPGSTKKYLKKDLVELAVTRGIKKTDARKMKKKDLLVILEIKDCDDSTEEQEGEEGEI